MDALLPIHRAQLLGYLLNFNVPRMRNGIVRMVNQL